MLFTYKYIHISDYYTIIEEIKNNIDLNAIKSKSVTFTSLDCSDILNKCVKLSEYIESNHLKVVKTVIVKINPGNGADKIHIDNCNAKTYDELKFNYVRKNSEVTRDILGLQIGLENVDKTYTAFYKYIDGEITHLNHINSNNPNLTEFPSLNFKNAEMAEIDRYTADRPVIFNATVPHTVINNTNNVRLLLSVRFDPDPWHLVE